MRYDQSLIDQIQSANDIVEVISQYIPLKRAGRNLKANCPFHGEKTPSFMVQPEKQIYHCFGCSAGGDVFSFIMRYENMSFPEAIRRLAERANIPLPEISAKKSEGPSESEQLYELYQITADFYHAQFLDTAKGKEARDYFQRRGFDMEIAKEFKIGWAADSWRNLLEHLSKKGFSEKILQLSGLISRSVTKGSLYDTFRGRLMFPIRNLQGKIVAFGGRGLTAEAQPKYLNSPENPIFHKRRELFGLNLARKFVDREKAQIFVVEGYFDFLRMYQAGFKSAAATLGTALSDDHVQILKRFADEAVMVYDGDKAGEAASLRSLEVLLEGGINIKVARVPQGFDPDDFILKKGNEAFAQVLNEARDFFDFKLETLSAKYNRHDSLGLMKITNEFLDTFLKVKNPVLLDRYFRKLAGALGVDENSLKTEFMKLQKKHWVPGAKTAPEPVAPAPKSPELNHPMLEELMVLSLAMENPAYRKKMMEGLTAEEFSEKPSQDLFRVVSAASGPTTMAQMLNRLQAPDQYKERLIQVSSVESGDEEKQKAFSDCVKKIKKKTLERQLDEVRRKISQAEREGKAPEMAEHMKAYHTLWRQVKQA